MRAATPLLSSLSGAHSQHCNAAGRVCVNNLDENGASRRFSSPTSAADQRDADRDGGTVCVKMHFFCNSCSWRFPSWLSVRRFSTGTTVNRQDDSTVLPLEWAKSANAVCSPPPLPPSPPHTASTWLLQPCWSVCNTKFSQNSTEWAEKGRGRAPSPPAGPKNHPAAEFIDPKIG